MAKIVLFDPREYVYGKYILCYFTRAILSFPVVVPQIESGTFDASGLKIFVYNHCAFAQVYTVMSI